jgi:LacI family transcriptional regulator
VQKPGQDARRSKSKSAQSPPEWLGTRRPTILDVAERSGVSKSTVSNVVRGAEHLSEGTRERVEAAIEELGYVPNALARDLKRSRTASIGLVAGDLRNPYYSELARRIEQLCAGSGYTTVLCATEGVAEKESERVSLLLEHQVSGIVFMHLGADSRKVIADLRAPHLPIVVIGMALGQGIDSVGPDDAKGAELAITHLAELGHERIAYVSSPYPPPSTTAARARGARRAAGKHDLPDLSQPEIDLGGAAAERGLAELIEGPDAPTAVFAGNDLTALALIDGLESLGSRVPEDLSVVGFDDIAVARLNRISLTTVHHPIEEQAELGVARLFSRIESGESPPQRWLRRKLTPSLVVRGTTKKPR